MKEKKPIFLKSLLGITIAFILAILLFIRANKSKSSFDKVSGSIVLFEKGNGSVASNKSSKFRLLQIDSYPKTFEIFVGKDWGDFKPKFEKLDDLKIGDSITIYFDENFKTKSDPVNRLAYFIDKKDTPVFIKGGWERYLAYFIWGIATLILLVAIQAKRKLKIT